MMGSMLYDCNYYTIYCNDGCQPELESMSAVEYVKGSACNNYLYTSTVANT